MRFTIFAKVSLLIVASILLLGGALTFTTRQVVTANYDSGVAGRMQSHKATIEEYINSIFLGIKGAGHLFANNQNVAKALQANDSGFLRKFSISAQNNGGLDFVTIADMEGKVVARSHIPASRDGESIANQSIAREAMAGRSVLGLQTANSSKLTARTANPIFLGDKQVGFVMLGKNLATDAVMDRLKGMLGAEVTIFVGDTREATTLVENGKRVLGTQLTNQQVLSDTLRNGRESITRITLFNEAYDAIYFPIRDVTGNVFGMFFVGERRSLVESTVSQTIMSIMQIGAVIALVMAAVGMWISYRTISVPINRSASAIAAIVDGSTDFNKRLNESGSDELAVLNHEVNRLIGKVEDILCSVEGFRNMVNAIPDLIFAVDDQYRILLANTATCEAAGVSKPESIYGKHVNDALGVDFYGTDRCPIRQTMKEKKKVVSEVFKVYLRGQEKWVLALSDEVHDCHGGQAGFLQVLSDMTGLVAKEEELKIQMNRIQSVNAEVATIAASVSTTSQAVRQQSSEIQQSAISQSNLLAEVLHSISQINETVLSVAQNTAHASSQAAAGQGRAQEGQLVVVDSVKAIDKVQSLTDGLRVNLGELGQQTEAIGQVMNVISDIADQTNLLALNAAIEAARAGEAGRGFAVVAGEVRKLAEKTVKATQEVRSSIESIQAGSAKNINSMEQVAEAVSMATSLAQNSGEALAAIVTLVSDTSEQVQTIAAASEEQSAATEQIKRSVNQVADLSDSTVAQTNSSVHSAMELSELADKLYAVTRS